MTEFDFARIAGRFGRVEPRRQARAYLLGLLSDVDTRTCWQLAEQAGDASPHRMQRLLGESVWDADDTGDLKRGSAGVGTQRRYTGTAGRIENSQVAVFLAYASRLGYTLIDREVYLPRGWTDDPARCAAAAVPEHVRFATKITLTRRMLTRASTAGVPAAWATATAHYARPAGPAHGYVLAVAKSHRMTVSPALGPQRADQITAALSRRAWKSVQRRCRGQGAA